jgi:hypothetical protein
MDPVPIEVLHKQLDSFVNEIDALINKCQTVHSKIDGTSKLCRKLIAEKKFLQSVSVALFLRFIRIVKIS